MDEWRRGESASSSPRDIRIRGIRGIPPCVDSYIYFQLAYISREEERENDGENDDDSNSKVIR